jgi:hypothetical protein
MATGLPSTEVVIIRLLFEVVLVLLYMLLAERRLCYVVSDSDGIDTGGNDRLEN